MMQPLSHVQRKFWTQQEITGDVTSLITAGNRLLQRLPNTRWCYANSPESAVETWDVLSGHDPDCGFWLSELHWAQWPMREG